MPETVKSAKEADDWVTPILTRDAAEQVRRAALPQKPEDYKVATTQAFKPPPGVEFKIDENDPLWTQGRAWAQKYGLSQDAFSEAIDLVAGSRISDSATIKAARDAEIDKLGTAGPTRITNLQTFFTGLVGADKAKQIEGMMVTAGIVEALESVVSKWSSQGAASFSQAHRDTTPQGRISDEEHAKLSPAERLNYAQRFDQSQFTNGRSH